MERKRLNILSEGDRMAFDRRSLLEAMGAAIAASLAYGCRPYKAEMIVPYSRHPPEITPGIPLFYATASELDGYGVGLVVKSTEGRPIKVEGNPEHPMSLGASGAFEQASLLSLYDPRRARGIMEGDRPVSWQTFLDTFVKDVKEEGRGLHFLLEPTSSPLLERLLQKTTKRFPKCQVYYHAPAAQRGRWSAGQQIFGRPVEALHRFGRAKVVLSLDDDFLSSGPTWLADSRHFARRRTLLRPEGQMNRLYVVEPGFTVTGAKADHRFPVPPSEVPRIAAAIAEAVSARLGTISADRRRALARVAGMKRPPFVKAIADDLVESRGASIVTAGIRQSAEVHGLCFLLNELLGNVWKTVEYVPSPILDAGGPSFDLARLVDALEAGEVERLVILGGNPVYTAPAEHDLEAAIARAGRSAYMGLYPNETARACGFQLAEAHILERWGDVRAADGTASVIQPLINPLFGGRTKGHVLAAFAGAKTSDVRELLRKAWGTESAGPSIAESLDHQPELDDGATPWAGPSRSSIAPPNTPSTWLEPIDLDTRFERILQRGLVPNSAFSPITEGASFETLFSRLEVPNPEVQGLELALTLDAKMHDGRFRHNAWLQEMPDPMTKLAWGNAALMSPATAASLDLTDGRIVRLTIAPESSSEAQEPQGGRSGQGTGSTTAQPGAQPERSEKEGSRALEARGLRRLEGRALEARGLPRLEAVAAVHILPGLPARTVVLPLGYGGATLEGEDERVGVDGYALWTAFSSWFLSRLEIEPVTGETKPPPGALRPVLVQEHARLFGRPIILSETLEGFRSDPRFAEPHDETPPSLHPPWPEVGMEWGMAIDLVACTGCSACVVACQAENNVPAVGKTQVEMNREMHWLRIDRYWSGTDEAPRVAMQPMLCQHCEKAPCEYVCPTNATVHSPDGLNEMVYNRCIGTRFCSNNCPYKVRRFNWFDWHRRDGEVEQMIHNPEVTVRARGVMEKCTYCVQRIRTAEIRAKREGRSLYDDEVITACAQACPTEAITFGDLARPASQVKMLHESPRAYAVLNDLGTRPRTRYLALIRNPNLTLEPPSSADEPEHHG